MLTNPLTEITSRIQSWTDFPRQKQSSRKYTNHSILCFILSTPQETFVPWQWLCHSPRPDWGKLETN